MLVALAAALAVAQTPALTRDHPGDAMPDRHWDVQHLDLDLRVDPTARTVAGTATLDLKPLGAPFAWVRLHQRGLSVDAVLVDGVAVEGWVQRPGYLDVPVGGAPREHKVAVRYHAKPELGLHFRGGPGTPDATAQVWSQGEAEESRYWFPSWDYPNDRFTYAGRFTVPDGLTVVSNGEPVGEPVAAEPGWKTWSWRFDDTLVSYLVTLVAGEYAVYQDTSGPTPIQNYVPTSFSEQTARRTTVNSGAQLAFFNELLGAPYPWPTYRQVFVHRFMYSGMENSTATTLKDELLLQRDTDRGAWTEAVLAHELAHQWFGDRLTCYGWRDLWLNEGITSYYEVRWLEQLKGGDELAARLRDYNTWARGDAAHPLAARGWLKPDERDNTSVYSRGLAVTRMLEVALGREVFDAAMRDYVARYDGQLVDSDQLRRVLEEHSGQHLGWLFDGFVTSVGFPEVRSSWTWENGELLLTLEQTGEATPWTFPVEVEVGGASGVERRRMWVEGGRSKLAVPMSAAPRWVAVDPDDGTLANWTREQPMDAWVAQLQASPSPYARLIAAQELGKGRDQGGAAATALSAVLADPHEPLPERIAAAEALGELGTAPAVDALVASAAVGEARLRDAVVEALGAVPPAADVVGALRRAVTEADAATASIALRSLQKADKDAARDLARKVLQAADEPIVYHRHVAALEVLGATGEERDARELTRWLGADRPRPVWQAATGALTTWCGDHAKDKACDALRTALMRGLDDVDYRERQHAVSLLGKVGGEPEARRLDALAATTAVPALADAATAAATAIRAPSAPPKPAVKDDSDRLKAIEERIERLETWR